MNKWLWYTLVVADLVLLIMSVIRGDMILALLAFGLAMFLKRDLDKIPLPKAIAKHKIYIASKKEIIEPKK